MPSLLQGLAKLNNHQLGHLLFAMQKYERKKCHLLLISLDHMTITISTCTLPAPLDSITLLCFFLYNNYFFFNIICTLLIYYDYGLLSAFTSTPAGISPPKSQRSLFPFVHWCTPNAQQIVGAQWYLMNRWSVNSIRQNNVNS